MINIKVKIDLIEKAISLKHLVEMSKGLLLFSVSPWHIFLLDYLGIITNRKYELTIKRFNAKFIIRAGTTDKWSVHEIILRDDYGIGMLDKTRVNTIVDLGANIGVFSVISAINFPNAKVYAYEPVGESFAYLKKNVAINNLSKRIFTNKLACSVNHSILKLNTDNDGRAFSSVRQGGARTVRAKTITLPEIFSKNGISVLDILKMDIEGSEYSLLFSLPYRFFKRIQSIVMESHNINGNKKMNGITMKNFLEQKGYTVTLHESILGDVGLLKTI